MNRNEIKKKLESLALDAENCVRENNYRGIGKIAVDVLKLLREEKVNPEVLAETIPRIDDALDYTVYNHYRYEILARYVGIMLQEAPTSDEVRPEAEMMLRLRVLLDDADGWEMMPDKKAQEAVGKLFTPEELTRIIFHPEPGLLKRDRVEYSWEWERIYYDMEEEVMRQFENEPRHMGMCFRIWSAKKTLLKDKYGIDWRTPGEMNPRVMFD